MAQSLSDDLNDPTGTETPLFSSFGCLSRHDLSESRSSGNLARLEGDAEKQRLERLGRQRPEKLISTRREIGFVFAIVMSQALTEYFVSGFTILIPTIVDKLDIPPTAVTWPASAFSLVVSSFLLPFGRIADMYGGFLVYMWGSAWYCLWGLVSTLAQNEIMLDVSRALQGLGPAAYLPSGLMLLGKVYRPGQRKNVIFSIYGAMAALGFYAGIFFAGVAGEYAGWRWFFCIGTILAFLTGIIAFFAIPSDRAEHKDNEVKMDWLGSATIVVGLILFVFAITESSHAPQGWSTPYIYVAFIVGVLFLAVAFYVEGWVAEQPLLPLEIFKIKNIRPFMLGLLFAYGTVGIFMLWSTLYTTNIMGASPFQLVAWYAPLGIGGIVLATCSGFVLHLVHANVLLFICTAASITASILFVLQPEGGNYWAWVFPAMWCATIAIDLLFSVANVFFSTALPARQQGLAGAISNVLMQLGVALLLGFADMVDSSTRDQGMRQSYKNAFWFNLALGATAMFIFMVFVRIDRAKSDYTADERELLKKQETQAEVH